MNNIILKKLYNFITSATGWNNYDFLQDEDKQTDFGIEDVSSFENRLNTRNNYLNLNKEKNLENIFKLAYRAIEKISESISSIPTMIADEWVIYFCTIAEMTSAEELQKLLAQVLVGKLINPHNYSKRFLHCFSLLDDGDLDFLNNIFRYILVSNNSAFFISDLEFLAKYNISIEDLLRVQKMGFLMPNELGITISVKDDNDPAIYNSAFIAFLKNTSGSNSNNLRIGIYLLNDEGYQLYHLISKESNARFTLDFIKKKKEESKNKLNFSIHKVNYISGNQINYDNAELSDQEV